MVFYYVFFYISITRDMSYTLDTRNRDMSFGTSSKSFGSLQGPKRKRKISKKIKDAVRDIVEESQEISLDAISAVQSLSPTYASYSGTAPHFQYPVGLVTLVTNDEAMGTGLNSSIFTVSSVDKTKPVTLKGLRLKGEFCVLPYDNSVDIGYENTGPVKVRFTFGIVKPMKTETGTDILPIDSASVSTNPTVYMFDEPGEEPWYYTKPRKDRLGASNVTASDIWQTSMKDPANDKNPLRSRSTFKMICQKTISVNGPQTVPLANNNNDDYQLSAHTLGKTVHCDWYIPVDLDYDPQGTYYNSPTVVVFIEDLSHTLQGLHYSTYPTVSRDDSYPAKWVMMPSTRFKQQQLASTHNHDNSSCWWNMRSFWTVPQL